MSDSLVCIKCPCKRKKPEFLGGEESLCNALVVIGKEYARCPKCNVFFKVSYDEDENIILKKIEKEKLVFEFRPFKWKK